MDNLAIYEYLRQNDNSAILNNTLPPTLPSTATIATEENKDTAAEKAVLRQFLTGNLSAPYFLDDVHEIRDYLYCGCRFDTTTTLTIPEEIETIGGNAFCNCNTLTSLTINEGVANIGEYTFGNCVALRAVTLPSTIQSIDPTAFFGCRKLRIVINQPANAIAGAPWGALISTVTWVG